MNSINQIPKPVIFATVAAVGCFIAALLAEPLLWLMSSAPAPLAPPPPPPKPVRLQVTQPNWDDIAKILDAMELTYSHFNGEIDCDIFFLNCGTPDANRINIVQLREFVHAGGILYASDLAYDIISEAFPNLMTFKTNPHSGDTSASVIDNELRNIAGDRVTIYYDTVAQTIDSISIGHVILQTSACPIMVVCPYGDGKIFFTSFHNHLQTNEKESALLKLLIMKQISAFRKLSVEDVSKELNIDLSDYRKLFLVGTSNITSPEPPQNINDGVETRKKSPSVPPLHIVLLMSIQVIIWTSLLCFGMALSIVAAQNNMFHKPMFNTSEIIILILGAILAGCIAGSAGQIFYAYVNFLGFLSRFIAWGLLGALVGYGMAFFLANLNQKWALRGGGIGGVLGAIGFLMFSHLFGDTVGRLLGAAILGACIGAMIGFVEQFYRNVWLMVIYDPRNFTQVNLGSRAITVGSSVSDTVFVKEVGAKAGTFLVVGDHVQYTDAHGKQSLVPGNRVKVGKVELVICSKDVPFSPSKFYPMKMSRAKELMKKT